MFSARDRKNPLSELGDGAFWQIFSKSKISGPAYAGELTAGWVLQE
jgi:hypothetical protein